MIVTRGIGLGKQGSIVTFGLGLNSLLYHILVYINKTHKRIITALLR